MNLFDENSPDESNMMVVSEKKRSRRGRKCSKPESVSESPLVGSPPEMSSWSFRVNLGAKILFFEVLIGKSGSKVEINHVRITRNGQDVSFPSLVASRGLMRTKGLLERELRRQRAICSTDLLIYPGYF